MAGIKIKRNDTVEVIAGKDKGKRGRVLRVIADKDRVLVEHVMMVKKTSSRTRSGTQGWHRRAGIANPHLERDAGSTAGNKTRVGSRHRWRQEGSFLEGEWQRSIAEKKTKK